MSMSGPTESARTWVSLLLVVPRSSCYIFLCATCLFDQLLILFSIDSWFRVSFATQTADAEAARLDRQSSCRH
ncbi:hypothetical protein IF1G_11148 [Cordyceps javanica]|uniref:Uncharacterized protein n=1 Tax=Cordyceps javanica TaxID=43265 RepID=A0A545UL65_9HYPO|nr:hypothetical protein IF1G_11148 [Cordyceps javanica]